MYKGRFVSWIFPALLALPAPGCAVPLTPVKTEVEAPSLARVQLLRIDDNIFKFQVYNLSNKPMVILRDEVLLVTPAGSAHRLPGESATGTMSCRASRMPSMFGSVSTT